MERSVVNLITSWLDCLSRFTNNSESRIKILTPRLFFFSTSLMKSFLFISNNTQSVHVIIWVCFLAYVLWKTLSSLCRQAVLSNEPRKVFQELAQIKLTDVILLIRSGKEIRLKWNFTKSSWNWELIRFRARSINYPQGLNEWITAVKAISLNK